MRALRPGEHRPARVADGGVSRGGPGEDRLGDGRHGDTELQGDLDRPATGALLLRPVEDALHQRGSGRGVDLVEHLGGDLDEERVEVALVPRAEHVGALAGREAGRREDVVGLGDELHVGVLDAVVDHLHEVTGAVRTHPRAARLTVDVGGDRLEQRPEGRIRLLRAARHDRRTLERADLTPGDPAPHEVDAVLAQRLLAAAGVLEVGVAAVDDDVALLEERDQLVDDRVGGVARLDHDDDPARLLQRGDELLRGAARHERPFVTEVADQVVDPALGAVVQRDGMPVTGEVAGEVAAHDGETGDADLGIGGRVHPGSLSLPPVGSQKARQQMATHCCPWRRRGTIR